MAPEGDGERRGDAERRMARRYSDLPVDVQRLLHARVYDLFMVYMLAIALRGREPRRSADAWRTVLAMRDDYEAKMRLRMALPWHLVREARLQRDAAFQECERNGFDTASLARLRRVEAVLEEFRPARCVRAIARPHRVQWTLPRVPRAVARVARPLCTLRFQSRVVPCLERV